MPLSVVVPIEFEFFFFLLQDDGDGNSWVLNNKGFQDCEMYAKLEEWLGRKVDEYWDTKFDNLELL
jgi:hypothetical protein